MRSLHLSAQSGYKAIIISTIVDEAGVRYGGERGYVNFFLLQDCVDENYNVKFWLNTPLFESMPMPKNMEEYNKWINSQLDFIAKRGQRIADYCKNPQTP